MNTNKYEACMKTFIGDPVACGYGIWDLALLKAASEIDRVTADLCSDLDRMAERFKNFAATIEGGFFTDSPTGYTTFLVVSNTARLRELKDQLKVLLRLRYNTDEIAAFYESLSLRGVQSHGSKGYSKNMNNINISSRSVAVIRSLIHARVEQLHDMCGPGSSQGQQDYVRETVGELSQILHELRKAAGTEF